MKNILTGITFILFLSLVACEKNDRNDSSVTRQVVIDTTISSGALFSLNLGIYGTKAVITKQPANFSVSSIGQTSFPAMPVYQYSYTNTSKSAVTEQVTLTVTANKGGGKCNKSKTDNTLITLNLKIQ